MSPWAAPPPHCPLYATDGLCVASIDILLSQLPSCRTPRSCCVSVDVDECSTTSGICSNGRCENFMGGYECLCDPGFEPTPQKTSCQGIYSLLLRTFKSSSVAYTAFLRTAQLNMVPRARCGLGRLAAWHLPGGPVGPPARWAASQMLKDGVKRRRGPKGP